MIHDGDLKFVREFGGLAVKCSFTLDFGFLHPESWGFGTRRLQAT